MLYSTVKYREKVLYSTVKYSDRGIVKYNTGQTGRYCRVQYSTIKWEVS